VTSTEVVNEIVFYKKLCMQLIGNTTTIILLTVEFFFMRNKQRPPDTFRFPDRVRESIEAIAAGRGISKNALVVGLLEQCLKDLQIKNPSEALRQESFASKGFPPTISEEVAEHEAV
jgi:hypothetical protein